MFRRQWSIQSAIWETELQERKIIIMALVVSVSIVTMTWRPHLAIFCTTLSHTPYKLQLPTEPPQSPPPCTVHAVCNGDTAMSHTGTRHYKMFLCIQQSLTTNSRIMSYDMDYAIVILNKLVISNTPPVITNNFPSINILLLTV